MFEFHKDKERYFKIQKEVTQEYVIPFLKSHVEMKPDFKVLEIGCGEAGVLQAFTDLGFHATGIELYASRIENAKKFMAKELEEGKVQFIVRNIYDIDVEKDLSHKFDLIILKDVIEHIPEQEKFISIVHSFLTPTGKIFFAFPPWQMPFGGHQQICQSKFLSKLPYFHLLPMFLYTAILKLFGESERCIQELQEIKQTGISIERFERIIKQSSFAILKKKFYLFNPIYKYKLGVNPKEQLGLISSIPYVRNFFTMGTYYLVG
jgi:2-polyprenyl-3-methyl-5-hydroxy-6-metoxy-1,4-benzoquinol methylase